MPDNYNNGFNNRDVYNSVNPPQRNGGRANDVGRVQPTVPYGEPRAYNGSQPQPEHSSQVYPGYPQQNSPYPQNPQYPQTGKQPNNASPANNPYGGRTSGNLYAGANFDEGDTVYEEVSRSSRITTILIIISIILVIAIGAVLSYMLFFKEKDKKSSSAKTPAAVTESATGQSQQPQTPTTLPEAVTEPDEHDNSGLVETPDVRGTNMRIARTKLMEMGFRVKFTEAYDDVVEADNIIDQNISPGQKVPFDTEITLTVSMGREPMVTVEVPSVMDMDYNKASEKLRELGFSVQLDFKNHSTIEKDMIISQSVPSGTKLEKGKEITLVVSMGPN